MKVWFVISQTVLHVMQMECQLKSLHSRAYSKEGKRGKHVHMCITLCMYSSGNGRWLTTVHQSQGILLNSYRRISLRVKNVQSCNERKTACENTKTTNTEQWWRAVVHDRLFMVQHMSASSIEGLKTLLMTHLWVTHNNITVPLKGDEQPFTVNACPGVWCLLNDGLRVWVLSPATCSRNDEAGEHDLLLSDTHVLAHTLPNSPTGGTSVYIFPCIPSVWALLLSVRSGAQPAEL